MITVLYFAKLKEDIDCDKETIDWHTELRTIADLKARLSQRGEHWQSGLNNCLCAVNHTMAQDHHSINDGDEIAFYPPVTGG